MSKIFLYCSFVTSICFVNSASTSMQGREVSIFDPSGVATGQKRVLPDSVFRYPQNPDFEVNTPKDRTDTVLRPIEDFEPMGDFPVEKKGKKEN